MLKGTTKTGFNYEIADETLDDWELLEALDAIDNGESGKIVTVVNLLLGKEQATALKNHIRDLNGRVSVTAMTAEVTEILTSQTELKN